MKLRRSIVGRIGKYAARALEQGNTEAAAAFEQYKAEAQFAENVVELCLYVATIADELIYNANRAHDEIEPATMQEASGLADVLVAQLTEIDRLADSGELAIPEALPALWQLVVDTANGLELALDMAIDRYGHDIDGAAHEVPQAIKIEFAHRRVRIHAQAAIVTAIVQATMPRRPLLRDGRCRRRGPPRARRTNNYHRCVPLGSNAPPRTRPHTGTPHDVLVIRRRPVGQGSAR